MSDHDEASAREQRAEARVARMSLAAGDHVERMLSTTADGKCSVMYKTTNVAGALMSRMVESWVGMGFPLPMPASFIVRSNEIARMFDEVSNVVAATAKKWQTDEAIGATDLAMGLALAEGYQRHTFLESVGAAVSPAIAEMLAKSVDDEVIEIVENINKIARDGGGVKPVGDGHMTTVKWDKGTSDADMKAIAFAMAGMAKAPSGPPS